MRTSRTAIANARDASRREPFVSICTGLAFSVRVAIVVLASTNASSGAERAPFPPVIELAALDGTTGFVLEGIDQRDYAGLSVIGAMDVNVDGIDDLVIGAHKAETGRGVASGEVYVVFGADGLGAGGKVELANLNGENGFVLSGYGEEAFTGTWLGGGDVNGDGWVDLILGAPNHEPHGKAYVVFGRAGLGKSGRVSLAELDGDNGFILDGVDSGDGAGIVVDAAD